MSTATLPDKSPRVVAPPRERFLLQAALLIGLALFSSGAAGLVNQVVWQRSLKVYLGGSEAICSMIVVLVFMGGLGVGSIWMGTRAGRLRNPLAAFGAIELLLAAVNLGICGILAADLSHSVFRLQTIALSLGVPLLALYAASALVILVVPCLLMGATMPLAAEACQRNLGLTNARLLGLLFFINTLGSVLGTVVSSGAMISHLGLSRSLIAAVALNAAAGVFLLVLALNAKSRGVVAAEQRRTVESGRPARRLWQPSMEEVLALGLGFCSLGYEMYLLRLFPLRHQPLPFTFAAVLTGFLLFWSLGAAWSSRREQWALSTVLRICALTVAGSIGMYLIDVPTEITGTWSLANFVLVKFPYFVPCFLFGYLFSLVATRAARSWGKDIGRVYGWNTCGACLGILAMTFVGYEIPFFLIPIGLALLLYAMQEYVEVQTAADHAVTPRWAMPFMGCGLIVLGSFTFDLSQMMPGTRMYCGRDGVIMLDDDGNMMWDGLWHSKLSKDGDHVGTNNWYLGVCPLLCHPTGEIEDVCIIGVATGITASTLAQDPAVRQVDGYDISHVLKRIHHDYPEGTLNLATNEKINLIWQDARTGLALSPKKYDLIQTQPLYLKQAGSSLLNSREFYQLISDRLKPGGVFCLYSNGTPEQAFVARETADQVFAHRESFFDGYLVVLSNDPIDLSEASLERKLARVGPLGDEIRNWPPTSSTAAILELVDRPALPAGDHRWIVTDDRPILEYPHYLSTQLGEHAADLHLPAPKQGKTR